MARYLVTAAAEVKIYTKVEAESEEEAIRIAKLREFRETRRSTEYWNYYDYSMDNYPSLEDIYAEEDKDNG